MVKNGVLNVFLFQQGFSINCSFRNPLKNRIIIVQKLINTNEIMDLKEPLSVIKTDFLSLNNI